MLESLTPVAPTPQLVGNPWLGNQLLVHFTASFRADASITSLILFVGKVRPNNVSPIGACRNHALGNVDHQRWFGELCRDLSVRHSWAVADFGTVGFEFIQPTPRKLEARCSFAKDKPGRDNNTLNAVRNGNLYVIGTGILEAGADGNATNTSVDAPVVGLGSPRLLQFDNTFADLAGGSHINLYNNVRSTNCTMWSEEDMQYRFRLDLASRCEARRREAEMGAGGVVGCRCN